MRRVDQQVREALHDVATPRALNGMVAPAPATDAGEQRALDAAFAQDDSRATLVGRPVQTIDRRARVRRRVHAGAYACLAAVGVLAASILVFVRWPTTTAPTNRMVSARELCAASLDWIAQADEGPWVVSRHLPSEGDVLISKRLRWKQIQTDAGTVDCFLSHLPDGRRVYQFEFPSQREFEVGDSFAAEPDLPSAQFTCSARRRGDRIVVIAVEGGAGDYREVLEFGISLSRPNATMGLAIGDSTKLPFETATGSPDRSLRAYASI